MRKSSKIISIIFALCFMLLPFGTAASAQNIVGDIDGDLLITADDAKMVLDASANLMSLSLAQMYAADIDSDGIITATDARMILRVASGIDIFK